MKSRAGKVGATKKTNQDNFIIKESFLLNPEIYFLAVFDGHGTDGHKVSQFLKIALMRKIPNFIKFISYVENLTRPENMTNAMKKHNI